MVAALKAGDDHVPEVLVRTHPGAMMVSAHRILGKRALAEDCAQEALINALRGISEFRERSSLKTWLHRKVCQECRDYLGAYRCTVEVVKRAFADADAFIPDEVPGLVKAVLAALKD